MRTMGVTFELIDAPYPHLCALYRCECGAVETRYGDESGIPPQGWQELPGTREDELQCLCPRCSARQPA
jgi:hypothetical protein